MNFIRAKSKGFNGVKVKWVWQITLFLLNIQKEKAIWLGNGINHISTTFLSVPRPLKKGRRRKGSTMKRAIIPELKERE